MDVPRGVSPASKSVGIPVLAQVRCSCSCPGIPMVVAGGVSQESKLPGMQIVAQVFL